MSREYGMIWITRHHCGPHNERIEQLEYSWHGPPVALISLDVLAEWLERDVKRGDVVKLGPYELVLGNYLHDLGAYECAQVTGPGALAMRFAAVGLWWGWVRARLIYTLAVWGGGRWPKPEEIPSWRVHVWEHWRGKLERFS